MKKVLQKWQTAMAVVVVAVVLVPVASSQPIWVNQGRKLVFSLEFEKPNFKGTDNFTTISSAVFLTLRWPWNERIIFVGELPLAHGELDFQNVNTSADNKLGNPYLGFEFHGRPNNPIFVELGIRAPVASSGNMATFVGFFADADRFEAFQPNVLPLLAAINLHNKFESGVFINLRGGTSIFLDTGNDQDESELYLTYHGLAGYQGDRFRIEGGLTGRLIITEDGNFGERTFMQVGGNASYAIGVFRPGVHFRLPLDDDLKEIIDFVFGINAQFQIE